MANIVFVKCSLSKSSVVILNIIFIKTKYKPVYNYNGTVLRFFIPFLNPFYKIEYFMKWWTRMRPRRKMEYSNRQVVIVLDRLQGKIPRRPAILFTFDHKFNFIIFSF